MRISYRFLACLAVVVLGVLASSLSIAGDGRTCPGNTPLPGSAITNVRFFNDCPFSALSVVNNYPASIVINDADQGCAGFANLHLWRFSENDSNRAVFENCSHYKFSASLTISGQGQGEAGLQIAPWWSEADGRVNVRTTDGEIACFGGRLPFYNFSGPPHNLRYTKGNNIWIEMIYNPRSLSETNPAQITYNLNYGGMAYSSGPLNFDMANPGEDPPHGLWGALYPHYAGGHFQPFFQGRDTNLRATWTNINFEGPSATPAENTTWGRLKALYR